MLQMVFTVDLFRTPLYHLWELEQLQCKPRSQNHAMADEFERAKSSDCQVDAAVCVLERSHTWDVAAYIHTGIHTHNCCTYHSVKLLKKPSKHQNHRTKSKYLKRKL